MNGEWERAERERGLERRDGKKWEGRNLRKMRWEGKDKALWKRRNGLGMGVLEQKEVEQDGMEMGGKGRGGNGMGMGK